MIGGILVDENQKVFKLCSIMLQYPQNEWLKLKRLKYEISLLKDSEVQQLFLQFLNYLEATSFENLCITYVSTFDFNDATTLYLTYSIFGDNQERGPALIELKQQIDEAGYNLQKEELPDYLPLILELAANAPTEITEKIFKVHRNAIEKLKNELDKLNSPYIPLINVCVKAINQYMKERKAS